MISSTTRLLLPALLLTSLLQAQVTSTSNIVGFTTVPIQGNVNGTRLNLNSLALTTNIDYQSAATALGTNTITDTAGSWLDDAFNGSNGVYYLEIVTSGGSATGTGVGSTYRISDTSTAPATLTLANNLAAGISLPLTYRVRKYWTLGSVFGATNSSGLQGGSQTSADQILLWNGNRHQTFYYQTSGIGGTGWRQTGDQYTDASSTLIEPTAGVVIKRGQSATLNVIISGALKTGQTVVTVNQGYNYIGNPFGADMTLTSSGLYTGDTATGVASGTDATTADQVQLWNGSTYTTYYYNSTAAGWRSSTDPTTNAGLTTIPFGTSFIIRRQGSSTFSWNMPQHPSSL
jgi:hypothetical protein